MRSAQRTIKIHTGQPVPAQKCLGNNFLMGLVRIRRPDRALMRISCWAWGAFKRRSQTGSATAQDGPWIHYNLLLDFPVFVLLYFPVFVLLYLCACVFVPANSTHNWIQQTISLNIKYRIQITLADKLHYSRIWNQYQLYIKSQINVIILFLCFMYIVHICVLWSQIYVHEYKTQLYLAFSFWLGISTFVYLCFVSSLE